MNYQQYFSTSINFHEANLHLSAHSHHFWPDVTENAQLQYWRDSASLADEKWKLILGAHLSNTQKGLAELTQFPHPENIVFAPNTHELIIRIFSAIQKSGEKLRILTTDSEFHSFERQCRRWEEEKMIERTIIPTLPFSTFQERFLEAAQQNDYDVAFFSQVFFNSGIASGKLSELVQRLKPFVPWIIVDGYHGLGAIPTNLQDIASDIFYLGGSYKYLMGGEGCCFAFIPTKALALRPINTGWFASFETLSEKNEQLIDYSQGAMRYAGATMDFSAMYRLEAVLKNILYSREQLLEMHEYIQQLQKTFLEQLFNIGLPEFSKKTFLHHGWEFQGHFLTFKIPVQTAQSLHQHLRKAHIWTDLRNDRLRFGFAIYHQQKSFIPLFEALEIWKKEHRAANK
ncbi:aminotransferase class V-fold PLP-dependent enzyme [Persicobacter diffluens]|uniref:Aminotransferase class V domain-containing protein n=1 Tax=Persicobacter diffluens TaxID=981 RepID=A0AAN5AKC1_9BACT|nr:hypothetical protein PEDI_32470 [Persicobacter diffluens]